APKIFTIHKLAGRLPHLSCRQSGAKRTRYAQHEIVDIDPQRHRRARSRYRDDMECALLFQLDIGRFAGRRDRRTSRLSQSALIPANLTTFAHFSVSRAMRSAKSAGEPGSSTAPSSTSFAVNSESASPTCTWRLIVSMTAVGVLLGAPRPCQALTSKLGKNS